MPRYFFHFVWPDDSVRDTKGLELEGFGAAYRHACKLVRQVRVSFSDGDEDWWIEISDGTGGEPAVVHPAMVPALRSRWQSGQ
jgi:hypothetical protein